MAPRSTEVKILVRSLEATKQMQIIEIKVVRNMETRVGINEQDIGRRDEAWDSYRHDERSEKHK